VKKGFVFLLFMVGSGIVLAQKDVSYRSEVFKFEIVHPASWHVFDDSSLKLSPTPAEEWIHGVGIPPFPNPWLHAFRLDKKKCGELEQTEEFKLEDYAPPSSGNRILIRTQVKCLDESLVFISGYYELSPNKVQDVNTLRAIVESFKKVP
jgi:hypothetical protein